MFASNLTTKQKPSEWRMPTDTPPATRLTTHVFQAKGFVARARFSPSDDCWVGELIGISDIVSFHAETEDGLEAAFKEAVDDHIDTLKKLKQPTQRLLKPLD